MSAINVQGTANVVPDNNFVFVRVTPNNLGGVPGFIVSTTVRTRTGDGHILPDIHNVLSPKPLGSGLLLQGGGCLVVATVADQNTQPNQVALTCEIGQDGAILFSDTQTFTLNGTQPVVWSIGLV